MAERPARRHPVLRFLIPQWRGTARASQRPPSRRKTEPPSSSQSPPQSSQTRQELANATPAAQQTKASLTGVEKNGKSSQRREYTSQADHPTEEFQITKTSQADEDERHKPFQTILVEASQETKKESGIKQIASSELKYISKDKAELADQNVQPSKPPKEQMFGNGELEQSIYPIQTTAEKAADELEPEEGGTKREEALEEDTRNNLLTEEPKKERKPKLSISVSDSQPKKGEFISGGKVEEQAKVTHKESTRSSCPGIERKITISAMTRPCSPNKGRPNMQKDLKDGLSNLLQKLSVGQQNKLGNEQGVGIITLAGENKGASMFIGYEGVNGEERTYIHRGQNLEKGIKNYVLECAHPVAASINSNVQGINNSVLNEITYREENPGIHMTITTKPTLSNKEGIVDSSKAQKAAPIAAAVEKVTYEPNIRRRCLRGLFLESSEDDVKDPQKPRRHGCKFSCDDKKKGKVEDGANVKN